MFLQYGIYRPGCFDVKKVLRSERVISLTVYWLFQYELHGWHCHHFEKRLKVYSPLLLCVTYLCISFQNGFTVYLTRSGMQILTTEKECLTTFVTVFFLI